MKINPHRKLSDKETETLICQILHPKLTAREHADMLGIDVLNLAVRLERIAKKFEVPKFAGVLAIIICENAHNSTTI